MVDYLPRLVDGLLDALLVELPALFITGPRATGKTTTAARRRPSYASTGRRRLLHSGPTPTRRCSLQEPVLLDGQAVPGVLGAWRRGRATRPGRLITGSIRGRPRRRAGPGPVGYPDPHVRHDHPGTLRVAFVPFLDRVVGRHPAADTPDLHGYVELLLRGGFPEPALRLAAAARRRWLDSYVEHLLTRDAEHVDRGRDLVRLRRHLEALALNTAGIVEDRTLFEASGINRKTALAYERLLANLLWSRRCPLDLEPHQRLVLSPSVTWLILVSLALSRLDVDRPARRDLLGRCSTLSPRSSARSWRTQPRARLYHAPATGPGSRSTSLPSWEADVSSGSRSKPMRPRPATARDLAALRDKSGHVRRGIVLRDSRAYRLGDRLFAAPISALWADRPTIGCSSLIAPVRSSVRAQASPRPARARSPTSRRPDGTGGRSPDCIRVSRRGPAAGSARRRSSLSPRMQSRLFPGPRRTACSARQVPRARAAGRPVRGGAPTP
jgi:hypothetical protein